MKFANKKIISLSKNILKDFENNPDLFHASVGCAVVNSLAWGAYAGMQSLKNHFSTNGVSPEIMENLLSIDAAIGDGALVGSLIGLGIGTATYLYGRTLLKTNKTSEIEK